MKLILTILSSTGTSKHAVYDIYIKTSWWFQPKGKIWVKLDHVPNFRGEKKTCLKPPPSLPNNHGSVKNLDLRLYGGWEKTCKNLPTKWWTVKMVVGRLLLNISGEYNDLFGSGFRFHIFPSLLLEILIMIVGNGCFQTWWVFPPYHPIFTRGFP